MGARHHLFADRFPPRAGYGEGGTLKGQPSVVRRWATLWSLAVVSLGVACHNDQPAPPQPAQVAGQLPPGVVARVGKTNVTSGTVVRIAQAQKVDLLQARDRAVFDTLLAVGARDRGLANQPDVSGAVNRALARAMVRQLWAVAQRKPINGEELATVTARHWLELDRPVGYRTVHVLVWAKDETDPEKLAQARELADRLHAAVQKAVKVAREEPAPNYKDDSTRFAIRYKQPDPASRAFIRATWKVKPGKLTKKVEQLPVISASGRFMEFGAGPEHKVVKEYADATALLEKRGDLSPVIKTRFGFHVIMLLEKIPGQRRSEQYRRKALTEEIFGDRAKRSYEAMLEKLRLEAKPQMAANVDSLFGLVKFDERKP